MSVPRFCGKSRASLQAQPTVDFDEPHMISASDPYWPFFGSWCYLASLWLWESRIGCVLRWRASKLLVLPVICLKHPHQQDTLKARRIHTNLYDHVSRTVSFGFGRCSRGKEKRFRRPWDLPCNCGGSGLVFFDWHSASARQMSVFLRVPFWGPF